MENSLLSPYCTAIMQTIDLTNLRDYTAKAIWRRIMPREAFKLIPLKC